MADPQLDFLQRANDVEKNSSSKSVVIGPVPSPPRNSGKSNRCQTANVHSGQNNLSHLERSTRMAGVSLFRSTLAMIAFCFGIIIIYRHLTLEIKVNKLEQTIDKLLVEFDAKVLSVLQSKYLTSSSQQPSVSLGKNSLRPMFPDSNDKNPQPSNLYYGWQHRSSNNDKINSNNFEAKSVDRIFPTSHGGRFVRDVFSHPTSTESSLSTSGCLCPPGQ